MSSEAPQILVFGGRLAEAKVLSCNVPCGRCGGTGVVRCGNAYARCRCQRPFDQVRAFNRAELPGRASTQTLENWRPEAGQESVLERCKQWADRTENAKSLGGIPFLVLSGPTGVGKTHLAVGLVRRLLLEGRRPGPPLSARFLEPLRLVSRWKAEKVPLNLAAACAAELVVMDDAMARTEFERSVVEEIVGRRDQKGGPFVVTTMLQPSEFVSAFGRHTASRLGSGLLVTIIGPDHRLRRAA